MGGDWSGFGSNLVGVLVVVRIFSGGGWLVGSVVGGDNFFWVILVVTKLMFVAEFWWMVLCGLERERQIGRGKRDGREERETDFFFFYIICWCSLYYFNKLYV